MLPTKNGPPDPTSGPNEFETQVTESPESLGNTSSRRMDNTASAEEVAPMPWEALIQSDQRSVKDDSLNDCSPSELAERFSISCTA